MTSADAKIRCIQEVTQTEAGIESHNSRVMYRAEFLNFIAGAVLYPAWKEDRR